jgi:hypothetical protein
MGANKSLMSLSCGATQRAKVAHVLDNISAAVASIRAVTHFSAPLHKADSSIRITEPVDHNPVPGRDLAG